MENEQENIANQNITNNQSPPLINEAPQQAADNTSVSPEVATTQVPDQPQMETENTTQPSIVGEKKANSSYKLLITGIIFLAVAVIWAAFVLISRKI